MNILPPAQIDWIVADVGEDMALSFVESACGRRIWVPREWRGSDLAMTYGEDIARCLSSHYGGEYIKIPICRAWRILMYRKMGLCIDDIAHRAGADRSWVKKVLANGPYIPPPQQANYRNDPAQLPLF
ncbi:hypothetical protein Geu3261_0144_032 [Komagataeibacter europaeus NBRC 3261]|uniref:Mor transcription activator domain-containing protein n=1 Tax=Komagataeibacter europaeus NBRC 3261 TaxID=1234669 RepID=A0A0D6Q2F6_KOMEU|nr:hypothetical protein [Komagataeibacter europaeus]GAN97160.1 hypothetical protein Geu3261_0144_032 [Komagataeibacter europaeus NBRC 3261]